MKTIWKIVIPFGLIAVSVGVMMTLIGSKETPATRHSNVVAKHVDALVVHPGPVSANITGYGRVASTRPSVKYPVSSLEDNTCFDRVKVSEEGTY